jgi:hypothetical protein
MKSLDFIFALIMAIDEKYGVVNMSSDMFDKIRQTKTAQIIYKFFMKIIYWFFPLLLSVFWVWLIIRDILDGLYIKMLEQDGYGITILFGIFTFSFLIVIWIMPSIFYKGYKEICKIE